MCYQSCHQLCQQTECHLSSPWQKELVFPEAISEEELIEKMSKEELLREYQDISKRLKHDHIKLERRV